MKLHALMVIIQAISMSSVLLLLKVIMQLTNQLNQLNVLVILMHHRSELQHVLTAPRVITQN